MGVVVLGRYTRVRWRLAEPDVLAEVEAPGTTALGAAALLDGAEEVWGIASGQPVLFSGTDVVSEVIALPKQPHVNQILAPPQEGTWLVGVEHSGSMWAALRELGQMEASELEIDWRALDLPGAGPLVIGRLLRGAEAFKLVAPPPLGGAFPARLDRDGVLLTAPFRPEKGKEDEAPPIQQDRIAWYLDGVCRHVTSRYRYGILADGAMRWLRIRPRVRPPTSTPTTALFRARLALFGRELAARGIYYQDDADETGYELRFAIEDGAVPSSFHEPEAALAYTVSGQGEPEDDKREQARQLYDPEDDWETGQFYAIDYTSMPARADVKDTRLVFYTSDYTKIDGTVVSDAWAEAHLDAAGVAAGLDGGASNCPSLSPADLQRLTDASEAPPTGWNVVEAADRVQRAAYALATCGTPDLTVEARLAQMRGSIVRALLGQDALRAVEAGDRVKAEAIAATLLPLAPGPFPRRAFAIIKLAALLADARRRTSVVAGVLRAVDDRMERRLALLFAERAGCALEKLKFGAATWAGEGGANALVADARRWSAAVAEPLLGEMEPPCIPLAGDEEDGRHVPPPTTL